MNLLRLLLVAFLLFVCAELYVLFKLGNSIGWGRTLLLVILNGLLGAWLARREGLRTIRAIQTDLEAGRMPADRLLDAVMILAAGILLILPGVLTDVGGVLLLLPPVRALLRTGLKRSFQSRFIVLRGGPADDDLIDVEAKSAHDRPERDLPRLE